MGLAEQIPIELECWMLRWGVMPRGHFRKTPDVVWPAEKDDRMVSKGWKPSFDGEDPPF